ncbi:DNA/RNA non-specific endonuclease [Telluribacter humicola]|uniref:DNA/RNA non-specific endonuclease n=1 Tax=Telluribacter humicola TaxID=1720261 RepID=UPI001A9778B7|nr:DNA/RNA non-specific endonuclease [Telluribacter humicola]
MFTSIVRKYLPLLLLALCIVACDENTTPYPYPAPESVHLSLGKPTNTKADTANATDFLMIKEAYALSYNRTNRHPNWMSWELTSDWLGVVDTHEGFRNDPELPKGWSRISHLEYRDSGFNMAQLCPNMDRTSTVESFSATYLTTNAIPIANVLHATLWAQLEVFARSLAVKGYHVFIIAGAYGSGGEGYKGAISSIGNGINVPAHLYKVIVAIPNGGNLEKINATTPVIAVDFPNRNSQTRNKSWTDFITTPEAIEKAAGVSFFTYLPEPIRSQLKTLRFDPTTSPIAQPLR